MGRRYASAVAGQRTSFMVVLPSPFSTNHSARIMSLMTGGKGQIVLLLRTGLRFVHQIQRDVAHGRGTEGADPKRSDAEAGEEEQVPERRSLSAISRSPLPAIELWRWRGTAHGSERLSVADAEGALRPTSTVQAVGRSRAEVSSPLLRRGAVMGTVLVKKRP